MLYADRKGTFFNVLFCQPSQNAIRKFISLVMTDGNDANYSLPFFPLSPAP
jgi:hypothetical protein